MSVKTPIRMVPLVATAAAAALVVGLAVTPAAADTVVVYDHTTANHHLVLTETENSDFLRVDITNLTATDVTWGLAADLAVPGSRTPLWTEDHLGDIATIDIGAGGTVTQEIIPNWSGQRLSFYSGVPDSPVLVDEFTIDGPFVPANVHIDQNASDVDLQIGFLPGITPSTVRIGESPYITVDGLPDGAYTVYLQTQDQVLSLPDLHRFWIPAAEALVVASGVPSTGGHLAVAVPIPSGLALGDYAITIGDPVAGWWPVGPLFSTDPDGSTHATNITVEAGQPRTSTPLGAQLVEPLDQFGQQPVSFTFDNVTTAGTTTVSTVTSGPPATGFQVSGGTYYELHTTAEFSGDVRVCIDYDTTPWVEQDGLWEALRLYHFDGSWAPLDDPEPPVFGTVCGVTSSFSPFTIGIPNPTPTYWPFEGFLTPVSSTALNTEFAGSIVPFRFRVGQNRGLDIFAGSPTSVRVNCTTRAPMGAPEVAKSVTRPELTYIRASNTYWYFWQTPTSWAGQCRTFTMKLDDGSVHTATFSFKKLTLGALLKAILKAF